MSEMESQHPQDPREPQAAADAAPPGDAPAGTPTGAVPPPLPPAAPRDPAAAAYVRGIFSATGMITLAWIAGTVLVAGALGAALLLSALAAGQGDASQMGGLGDLGGADFGQAIGGLLILIGAALGGGIALDADLDAGFFSASGVATLRAVPLGVTALVVTGVVIAARLRQRHDRALAPSLGAEAARAAVEGGLIALAITVITGFAKLGGSSEFGGAEVRTQAGLVFLTVLVVVSLSLFSARAALRRSAVGAIDGRWVASLREAGRFLAVQFSGFGAVALVILVIASVRAESAAPLLAALPLLGNLAAFGAALGQFGGASVGAGSLGSESVTAFDLPDGYGAWLIVAAVLVLIAAAGVVGLKRPRTAAPDWSRVWQMPLIVFAVWCVLALGVAGANVDGEMLSALSLGFGGSIGLTWPTPFLAGIGAGLASVGAEYLPLLVYRLNPSLLALFGGRRAVQQWLYGVAPVAPTSPARASEGEAPGAAGAAAESQPASSAMGTASAATAASRQAPAAEHPGPADPVALPARAPLSPRAKTRLIVALSVVGSVLVLGIGAAVTVSLVNQSRDPAAAVQQYLALLESGKAEQATKLVDPGLQNRDRQLLTDEVLAAAEHRIEVVEVETTARSDDGANVHVVYSLDGERFEVDLPVEAGPKELLVLDTWRLQQALTVPVSLSGDGVETVLVGETEIELEDPEGYGVAALEAHVYPGVYSVTGAAGAYLTASTEELRASSPSAGPAYAEVSVEPSPKLEEEVLQQVQARIAQCVEIPTNMDDVCPYVTRDKDLSEMRVVAQPQGFEELSPTRFTSLRGTIAVRSNPTSWDADPELRESEVSVSGEIDFQDGKPVISELWMGGW